MKFPHGLQARFQAVVAIVLLLSLLALSALLHRQWTMQQQLISLSRDSIQTLVLERLRAQAQAMGTHTAETLVNPLYNFDLEMIGRIVEDVLSQPDVHYVTVFDPDGAVIHDGSDDIASYGQIMSDESAQAMIDAESIYLEQRGDVLDVAAPIRIGEERLGGVRIGYSMASVRRYEERASQAISDRIAEIGQRSLLGIGALLLLALAIGVVISVIVQRTLIQPIRRLANAAREIEAGNFAAPLPKYNVKDEIGDLVQAFSHMTQAIYRRDQDIQRIANTDALTGLANRRAFRAALDGKVASPPPSGFALMLIDVDNFKPVNDGYGHETGDRVLCHFADRLRKILIRHPEVDGLPARLGGDEFIMVVSLKNADEPLRDRVGVIAADLIESFSQPIVVGEHSFVSGASIGIALCPNDARVTSQLLKFGDLAMYAAKRAGKNGFRFYDEVD
jgi:diguanylate cyclase (GGDEF)-like protein